MKNKLSRVSTITSLLFSGFYAFSYVDFDVSMNVQNLYHYVQDKQEGAFNLNFFRNLYNQVITQEASLSNAPLIPHIIHIIWLGPKLPLYWQRCIQSWRKYHPSWTIFLYLDHPELIKDFDQYIEGFDQLEYAINNAPTHVHLVNANSLHFDNRVFFDQTRNYAERSDILRFELLYRFGGLYVDADFEALKPFDELHNRYLFYTGIQSLDTCRVQLGSALIATASGHIIMKECCERIKYCRHFKQIIVRTGPIFFTKIFIHFAANQPLTLAFPASYFYPCGYEQKGKPAAMWQEEESYAVHHWAGDWLKPEGSERINP